MELVTGVWKLYRCVEAKEDLLYRFSAAGPVDWGSNQSTGGVPGALCMKVHRDQSTAVTVQSTGYLPESLTVDWGSDQSTGQVPGAACMSQCTGAVDCCHSAVDWKSTREFRQSTVYTVSRLVTPRLKPSVDWCFGPVDWSTGSGFWSGFYDGF